MDELPQQLSDAVASVMPRTTALFEQLPGGSLHSVIEQPHESEATAAADPVVLRGGLGEKSERWSQYAQLCVQGFGANDPRAIDAVRKAEEIAGAWEGQRTLVRAGLVRPCVALRRFSLLAYGQHSIWNHTSSWLTLPNICV